MDAIDALLERLEAPFDIADALERNCRPMSGAAAACASVWSGSTQTHIRYFIGTRSQGKAHDNRGHPSDDR